MAVPCGYATSLHKISVATHLFLRLVARLGNVNDYIRPGNIVLGFSVVQWRNFSRGVLEPLTVVISLSLCKVDSVVTDRAIGRTLVQRMYIVHLDYQICFSKLTYLMI